MSVLQALGISDQASLWGLNVVIHATVLAAMALLVSQLLRRAAAMRYWVLCFGLAVLLVSPVTSALIQASGNGWLKIAVAAVSEPTPKTPNPNVPTVSRR